MSKTSYTAEELEHSRRAWQLLEAYHDTTYFVKECRDSYKRLGVGEVWARYFAGRAAPMGRVSAGTVIATFYNFSPTMVKAAIPSVWDTASPEEFIKARLDGVDAALRRLIPKEVDAPNLADLADLAMEVAVQGRPEAKPIYAANLDLSVSDSAHLRLFQAATLVREHKGDAHNALLMVNEISGCQAHVLMAAIGHGTKEQLQPFRGWSDDEWAAAEDDLKSRSLIGGDDNRITEAGRSLRMHIEHETERVAAEIYRSHGFKAALELATKMAPITASLIATGELPTAPLVYDELNELA